MNIVSNFRKKLFIESVLVTILVFLILWVFFITIKISFKPFNYVEHAIGKVQLTDMYFSQLGNNNADTNIILVNIEDIDRKSIAKLLMKIDSAGALVIGMDVFFLDRKDSIGDPALENAFSKMEGKLVLSAFIDPETNLADPKYRYYHNLTYGHANLPNNETHTEIIRWFNPKLKLKNDDIWAFSAMIAKKYSEEDFNFFTKKSKNEEDINYLGDINSYSTYNHDEIISKSITDLKPLKGKIVMVGYLGGRCRTTDDMNDKFFTPVNPAYFGKSLPDMYGLVVHANIVSMILNRNYIESLPVWLLFLISFIIVYLHVVLFAWISLKKHLWYSIASKLIQLISFSAILLIVFLIFTNYNLLFQTKYLLLGIILSGEALSIYESLVKSFRKKLKIKSLFVE